MTRPHRLVRRMPDRSARQARQFPHHRAMRHHASHGSSTAGRLPIASDPEETMSDNSDAPTTIPSLPPRRTSRRGAVIGAAVIALVVGGGAGFATGRATASNDAAAGQQLTTVKIGVTDADQGYWPVFKKLARQHGINLQTVNFQDYTQANPAVAQGQLDLNLFQHLVFLASYNEQAHQNLTPIGSTYVVPLSLYSSKYQKLKQIPAGGTIAIPNDPT